MKVCSLFLAAAIVLLAFPAQAQVVVNFPDPNLEAAIRDAIGMPSGDIYDTDLVGVGFTELHCYMQAIDDLTGLEYCTDLTDLRLTDNSISDITPLAGLDNLTSLDIHYNPLSDITALSGLTNLVSLGLSGCNISDINALANLTNLTDLTMCYNNISDISPLQNLVNLTYLSAASNDISDISTLAGLTNLWHFDAPNNTISDLTPLSGLSNLSFLRLEANNITDITALVENPGLGPGDGVHLSANPLGGEALNYDIPALLARGVDLSYDGAFTDSDADGVSDVAESDTFGTDPADPDSDDDGFGDGVEVYVHGTDPLDPDSHLDTLWTMPAPLNTNAATDSGADLNPQLATDGAGNWVAVWQSNEELGGEPWPDFDIWVSRSTDNGATWTAPAVLNTNAATDEEWDWCPRVATDGAGNWVCVWYSEDDLGGTIGTDGDILVARSTDNGATWTPPAPLNTNAATDSGQDGEGDDGLAQDVATDGAGNWLAIWYRSDSIEEKDEVVTSRSTDNGATWTAPAVVHSGGWAMWFHVTVDGAGNWVAVWMSNNDLGGTIGGDWDILVARSTDNGATWTAPVALNTNAATDEASDLHPRLATDRAGNSVAVWQSSALGVVVARSTDNGATWTDPAPLIDENVGPSAFPDVTADGAGNWVAVWRVYAGIVAARSTDNGATWTTPALMPTSTVSAMGSGWSVVCPNVATDGAGNWVCVWTSEDDLCGTIGTDWDILFSINQFGGTEDSDGDGLPDGWEVDNDLDPNDDTGDNGADGDPDGDGYTNLEEYDGGSDPQDENSVPGTTITADFSASPTSGNSPLTVQFTDQSTGAVTSWAWGFGDGGTSTEQSPSYTYNTAGSFDVSLTVTGPGGSDTETKARYIRVTTQQPVTAHFTASPTSGSRPLAVVFTDQSAGPITSWEWDFGDGYTSTAQNPSHTYYFTGNFTASLAVSGASGSDTTTAVINVDQALPADGLRYKAVIDDIKVIYTKPTCFACYNELSDTLLVAVWGDEPGALTVKAGEDASAYWGSRCDIYIAAPDASLKKINLKGREEMDLYVCGQVDYVKNFKLKYGFVGDTGDYGEAFGLGSAADDPPKNVLIKWGATTASVLGLSYPDAPFDLTPELKSETFVEPELGDYDDDYDYEYDGDDDEDIKVAEIDFDEVEALLETKAAYEFEYGDVKVLYSLPGCEAFYNDTDGTLTIQVTENDGNLTVKCGEEAYLEWGDSCDVYIDAAGASINTINLKGRLETQLHVCGEVSYVKNFKLKYGCVGDTEFYGEDYGLGCTSLALPNKIKIKWGWTTAPLLGVSY